MTWATATLKVLPAWPRYITSCTRDTRLEQEMDYVRAEGQPGSRSTRAPSRYVEELNLRTPPKGRVMIDPDTSLA